MNAGFMFTCCSAASLISNFFIIRVKHVLISPTVVLLSYCAIICSVLNCFFGISVYLTETQPVLSYLW